MKNRLKILKIKKTTTLETVGINGWNNELSLRDLLNHDTIWIHSAFWSSDCEVTGWRLCSPKQCQCVHCVWEGATQYKTWALRFFFLCWLKVQPVELWMEIYAAEWSVNTSIRTEAPSPCPGVSTQLSDSNRQLYKCQKVANSLWNVSQRNLWFVRA